MVTKTILSTKQGATYIAAFDVDDDTPLQDYTGWKVIFIVKKTLSTSNSDAIINEQISVNALTGQADITFPAATTTDWPVGDYVYGAVLVDSDNNVGKTDNGIFRVEDTAYDGVPA